MAPLLPPHSPHPKGGRPFLDDRACFTGIVFVLKTGIQWEDLPQEMGCGSGMTCWRRLRDWQEAGVFDRLQEMILARLEAAGELDWSRAVVDASLVRAKGVKKGANRPGPTRRTAHARRRNATSSRSAGGFRSPS
jgi:transposase